MTSAMSSGEGMVGRSLSSAPTRSYHETVPPGLVLTTVGTATRISGLASLHSTTDAPAWRRMAGSLGGAESGQQRHGHCSGLVNGEIRQEPLDRLIGADDEPDPVPRFDPEIMESPGEPIGLAVPHAHGEISAIGQISPGHGIGERVGQRSDQLCLQHRHAERVRWTGRTR